MKNLKERIQTVLGNENGGPNVEQLIGIALALAVGSGLFVFGSVVYNWFEDDASKSVGHIKTPAKSEWDL